MNVGDDAIIWTRPDLLTGILDVGLPPGTGELVQQHDLPGREVRGTAGSHSDRRGTLGAIGRQGAACSAIADISPDRRDYNRLRRVVAWIGTSLCGTPGAGGGARRLVAE